MNQEVFQLIGGGAIALLVIKEVTVLVKGVLASKSPNGSSAVLAKAAATLHGIHEEQKRQTEIIEGAARQTDRLHEAHLGPVAMNGGRPRWYGDAAIEAVKETTGAIRALEDTSERLMTEQTEALKKCFEGSPCPRERDRYGGRGGS